MSNWWSAGLVHPAPRLAAPGLPTYLWSRLLAAGVESAVVRPCVSSAPSTFTLVLVLMLGSPTTSAAQVITAPDGSAPRPHRTAHRSARLGWFAEIGGGWIALDTGEYSLDFGSGRSDSRGAGWSIGGGYQANPWIASTLNVRWWRLTAPETYVGPTSTIEYE